MSDQAYPKHTRTPRHRRGVLYRRIPLNEPGAPPPVVFTQEQAAAAGAPPPKSFTKEEAQELNDVRDKENARFITVEERRELLKMLDKASKICYN